jgi:hypothetical protein
MFGVLPLGIHTIHIAELNRDNYTVRSRERNRFVPVWNHTITLRPCGASGAEYTDVVELDAGRLTCVIAV